MDTPFYRIKKYIIRQAAKTIASMKKFRTILICVLSAILICVYFAPQYQAYADGERVYLGGFPIGISVDVDGLLVENVTGVETEYGMAAVEGIHRGDIIKSINGKEVESADDITDGLTADLAKLEILRGDRNIVVEVTPIVEAYTGKPKLGVKIKDKIYGVGTVTFVRGNGRFVALGHEICDSEMGMSVPFDGGHSHACKLLGVKRGAKGEAGALLATLMPDKITGTIDCNNGFGVSGRFTSAFDKSESMELARRDEVKPGAAVIRTTVDGAPEEFEIEIIKASKQSERKEKGIVFRVTDKRLLETTGGIVRGMSGSPIIQNGKIIAACTHVFLNDFTKGYGVYADFLNQ